jgi:hypothetical protein
VARTHTHAIIILAGMGKIVALKMLVFHETKTKTNLLGGRLSNFDDTGRTIDPKRLLVTQNLTANFRKILI